MRKKSANKAATQPTKTAANASIAPSKSEDQDAGEPSTEGATKNIKVKTSGEGEKKGKIRAFFSGLVKGVKNWTAPKLNPCLKAITGQVVIVTDEDILMQKELEKDEKKQTEALV